MSLVISLIYILDIIILVFILAHRGHLHGMLGELYLLIATLISTFAAFANFPWLADIIRGYWSPSGSIPEGIAFGLIYCVIRGGTASAGLYLQNKIRRVELIGILSKIIGVIFGAIKGLVVASVILVFLYQVIPDMNALAEPLHNSKDKIVQATKTIAPSWYNTFVQLLGFDQLTYRE